MVPLCVGAEEHEWRAGQSMDQVAEAYVKLVLATGALDEDYVDAYYGPPEWRASPSADSLDLATIRQRATSLVSRLNEDDSPGPRRRYLTTQLQSLIARVELLEGARLTFDEESQALYDAVAPTNSDEHFQRLLEELTPLLPGDGTLAERYELFRQDFLIPQNKLASVFEAAITECRERSLRHLELPSDESFEVEYVTDKSWSAYNWYQGGFHSLIQVNTDLPIYIDRAVDLACHEGYPGHHVYNVLLEKHLVRDRGWVEFSVYPLFSPQSLIAEGTANYGIRVAFPRDDRVTFERDILFPKAGLDPTKAEHYYRVLEQVKKLKYAGNEAARGYLNGEIDASAAAAQLVRYTLITQSRAEQAVGFYDQYRSYVINYNLGEDLVRQYIERQVGAEGDRRRTWEEFGRLLSSPSLPSDLRR
jgi:hypothetical protein